MLASLARIWRLGLKEFFSLAADPVLALLIVYSFSYGVYSVAAQGGLGVHNAAVGIVDQDDSGLSRALGAALLPPEFKAPQRISSGELDAALDEGRFVFVIDIPPRFEADLLAGHNPEILVHIDATAMSLAGNGYSYIAAAIQQEIEYYLLGRWTPPDAPFALVTRAYFNPNLNDTWHAAGIEVINSITVLSIILAGAAIIREREHGTLEHLLVMPVRASEIVLSKVWANGAVIVFAALLSLLLIVNMALKVPIQGSLGLFMIGALVYQFAIMSLGILLATVARSMAQFGLLVLPVIVVLQLLSGGQTPFESMPAWLRIAMQFVPSTHFVAFSQGVLSRGAGFAELWPALALMAATGAVYLAISLARFRATIAAMR